MRLFTLRGPVLRVPWPLVIAAWLARAVARVVVGAIAHPWATLAVAAVAAVYAVGVSWGWLPLAGLAGALCLTLGAWGEAHPASFEVTLAGPVRSAVRRVWVYRRHWQPATEVGGLAPGGRCPDLVRVTSTATGDVVLVRPVPGQTLDDWRAAAPRLAAAFAARVVRVRRSPRVGLLELHVARRGAPAESAAVPDESTAPRGAFPRAPR